MKWLVLFASLVTPIPAHASGLTWGLPSCGTCHVEAPKGASHSHSIEELVRFSVFDPPNQELFLIWNNHPPTPQTPLPTTLPLFAGGLALLWLGHTLMKDERP